MTSKDIGVWYNLKNNKIYTVDQPTWAHQLLGYFEVRGDRYVRTINVAFCLAPNLIRIGEL